MRVAAGPSSQPRLTAGLFFFRHLLVNSRLVNTELPEQKGRVRRGMICSVTLRFIIGIVLCWDFYYQLGKL